jgi:hypothetical protein
MGYIKATKMNLQKKGNRVEKSLALTSANDDAENPFCDLFTSSSDAHSEHMK